jgi:hypothetical protein
MGLTRRSQCPRPRGTEWTGQALLSSVAGMASRRQRFDPLRVTHTSRWLSRLDAHNRIIEVRELPAGTDLRNALDMHLAQLQKDGWVVEGVSFSGTFVHRGSERNYVAVYPADPRSQPISLHGAYPGAKPSISR